MATIDKIEAEKDAALDILEQKIIDAIKLKTSTGDPRMPGVIHELMEQRTEIHVQDYVGSMHDPDMLKALAIMTSATTRMTDVAATMKLVADYVAKMADLLSGSAKVVQGLKGILNPPD